MSDADRPVWVKAGTYQAVMVDWKRSHPHFGRQDLLRFPDEFSVFIIALTQ